MRALKDRTGDVGLMAASIGADMDINPYRGQKRSNTAAFEPQSTEVS